MSTQKNVITAAVAFAVLIIMVAASTTADAYNTPKFFDFTYTDSDGQTFAFNYSEDGNGVLLSRNLVFKDPFGDNYTYTPYEGNIVIPSEVVDENGITRTVIGIDSSAFWTNSSFAGSYKGPQSVSIPDTVVVINGSAFDGCSELKTITLGENTKLATIGNYAFAGCSSLTEFNIPSSVTYIGNAVFSGCEGIQSLTIPANTIVHPGFLDYDLSGHSSYLSYEGHTVSFEEGSRYSFSDEVICDNEDKSVIFTHIYGDKVIVPEGIETYKANPNKNVIGSRINSVSLPSTLTTIEDGAFYKAFFITSITIPQAVTYIGMSAFSGCGYLETVSFEDGNAITSIPDGVFKDCTKLANLKLPDTVESIGKSAFSGTAIESIVLPSLDTIPDELFYGCTSLSQITIPYTVKSIGERSFEGCSSITEINIPSGVKSIGALAFSNCSALTCITMASLDGVDPTFLSKSNALESVIVNGTELLSDGMIISDNSIFSYVGTDEEVVIPSSVVSIGAYSFSGVGLKCVLIPDTVVSIGECAFSTKSSSNNSLKLVILGNNVTDIADDAFPKSRSAYPVSYIVTSSDTDTSVIQGRANTFYTIDGTKRIVTISNDSGTLKLSVNTGILSFMEAYSKITLSTQWVKNGVQMGSGESDLQVDGPGLYSVGISFSTSEKSSTASFTMDVHTEPCVITFKVGDEASTVSVPYGSDIASFIPAECNDYKWASSVEGWSPESEVIQNMTLSAYIPNVQVSISTSFDSGIIKLVALTSEDYASVGYEWIVNEAIISNEESLTPSITGMYAVSVSVMDSRGVPGVGQASIECTIGAESSTTITDVATVDDGSIVTSTTITKVDSEGSVTETTVVSSSTEDGSIKATLSTVTETTNDGSSTSKSSVTATVSAEKIGTNGNAQIDDAEVIAVLNQISNVIQDDSVSAEVKIQVNSDTDAVELTASAIKIIAERATSLSITANDITITIGNRDVVDFSVAALDANATVDINLRMEVTHEMGTVQKDVVGDNVTFSLSITVNGMSVAGSFQNPVMVGVPFPEAGPDWEVYHVDDSGRISAMNARAIDGYMLFEAPHFSYYVIAPLGIDDEHDPIPPHYVFDDEDEYIPAITPNQMKEVKSKGDNAITILACAAAAVVASLMAVFLVIDGRRK